MDLNPGVETISTSLMLDMGMDIMSLVIDRILDQHWRRKEMPYYL